MRKVDILTARRVAARNRGLATCYFHFPSFSLTVAPGFPIGSKFSLSVIDTVALWCKAGPLAHLLPQIFARVFQFQPAAFSPISTRQNRPLDVTLPLQRMHNHRESFVHLHGWIFRSRIDYAKTCTALQLLLFQHSPQDYFCQLRKGWGEQIFKQLSKLPVPHFLNNYSRN